MSRIYDALRPYQLEGAKFGRNARHFLLADQPGLGKTIQTLATIVSFQRKDTRQRWHLVFCPSVAVLNVWEPEVQRWLSDWEVEVLPLTGTLTQRARQLKTFDPKPWTKHIFVVTNIESARIIPGVNEKSGKRDVFSLEEGLEDREKKPRRAPDQFQLGDKPIVYPPKLTKTGPVLKALFRPWDTVVVDESQRALIDGTGVTTATRKGFVFLGKLAERRIALSGTPMRGKPAQLWGTLNWLRPDLYRSKWNWIKEHFVVTSNGFSQYVIETDERGNAIFIEGARRKLARSLQPIMLRRTKGEVVPELPPKEYAGTYIIPGDEDSPLGVWLEPTPKMKKQLKLFESDLLIWDEETGAEMLLSGSLSYYTRARQLANCVHTVLKRPDGAVELVPTAEGPKLDWLVNWLEQSDGAKIVVVSQFTSILKVYARALRDKGYSVGLLTGDTSMRTRKKLNDTFQQTDELQVFMLNTSAGGTAITLDTADYMVFLDETTIPDDQEQAEDRIHRVSRMHSVTIYYLRTLGTIEEEVAYVAATRANIQSYLLDGARGVESAKKLYIESKGKWHGDEGEAPGTQEGGHRGPAGSRGLHREEDGRRGRARDDRARGRAAQGVPQEP